MTTTVTCSLAQMMRARTLLIDAIRSCCFHKTSKGLNSSSDLMLCGNRLCSLYCYVAYLRKVTALFWCEDATLMVNSEVFSGTVHGHLSVTNVHMLLPAAPQQGHSL